MPSPSPTTSTNKKWPVPMEVKPSRIDGSGLFTKIILRTRQKIGEYEGERITQREGRKRARTQKRIAIVEVNNGKAIDAGKETTGFRFINHSCTPNTFIRITGERAEFYALCPIKAETELTSIMEPPITTGNFPVPVDAQHVAGFCSNNLLLNFERLQNLMAREASNLPLWKKKTKIRSTGTMSAGEH